MDDFSDADGDDPFWTQFPSEFQVRDVMAGALHAWGWAVYREVCIKEGLRIDLLACRKSLEFHVVEFKYRIRSLLEAERAVMQCAEYVVAVQDWAPEATVVGYVTAGGFGSVSDATLRKFTTDVPGQESRVVVCRVQALLYFMEGVRT